MAPAHVLLGILAEGPAHGYDLEVAARLVSPWLVAATRPEGLRTA